MIRTNTMKKLFILAVVLLIGLGSCKKDTIATDPADQFVGAYQGNFGPVGSPSASESCKVIITKPKDGFIDIVLEYAINSSGKRVPKIIALQKIKVISSTAFSGENSNILLDEISLCCSSTVYRQVTGSVGGGNISFTVSSNWTFNGKKT